MTFTLRERREELLRLLDMMTILAEGDRSNCQKWEGPIADQMELKMDEVDRLLLITLEPTDGPDYEDILSRLIEMIDQC